MGGKEVINIGSRIVNNYLYRTGDGYVLIDTGYENGYKKFLKRIAARNIALSDIKYVFLTHAHDDHAGFLNELLANSPSLKVIMSEQATAGLFRGQNSFDGGCTTGKAQTFCGLMKLLGKGGHFFPKIDASYSDRFITVTEGDCGELENILQGKIIATPGHTHCSISLLLNDKTLFCGDAAMNGFPSTKNVTIFAENKDDYVRSWEKIIALGPAIIYPGHGKPFSATKIKKHLVFAQTIKLRPLKPSKYR